MKTTKHFLSLLLCVLLCVPATFAQPQQNPKPQDVTIIIQQEQVRFTSQKAVQMMQLQIFNEAGESVYDSGPTTVAEINWPLQNANGEALKSGLYAYTLTLQESGSSEARVRRGHFIVDRAQDRDGKTDKLWITSQSENGVGTELTVATSKDTTIAGTSKQKAEAAAEHEAGVMAEEIPEGQVVKTLNGLTDNVALEAGANVTITPKGNALTIAAELPAGQLAGTGTAGQLAKFNSGTELGDSVLTEANGTIGIGTTSPSGRLHILGSPDVAGTVRFQPDPSKGANHSHVHWGATGDWYLRSAAAAGKVILQDTGGSVGIGTANPTSSKLTIEGQNALTIQGYEPLMTFSDLNSPDQFSHRIQSAHGDLNFFQGYRPVNQVGFTWTPRMTIKSNGSVGIGTATPFGELHIVGFGPFITLEARQNGVPRQTHIQNADGTLVFKPAGFGSCCAALVMQANTGNIGIGTSNPAAKLDVAGRTKTQSLEITGGADFAENFDVNFAATSETLTKVEAGMVVSIDPTNPGKLQLSTQAYDRRVAGIISGAGGVKPGMMMSQAGTLADGQHPVALSGRVYVWVDATRGAVKPGDLLTTSATPGHAMKVTNSARAQGAIIGKAMTGLKEGKGLVLVLVTLQ